MFFVYILYSESAKRYYIGHTEDLYDRLSSHNTTTDIQGRYTRKNGPWELVYFEANFQTRSAAMRREKEIKSWKSAKQISKLIAQSAESRQVGINHWVGGSPDINRD